MDPHRPCPTSQSSAPVGPPVEPEAFSSFTTAGFPAPEAARDFSPRVWALGSATFSCRSRDFFCGLFLFFLGALAVSEP